MPNQPNQGRSRPPGHTGGRQGQYSNRPPKQENDLQKTLGDHYPNILQAKQAEHIADFIDKVKEYAEHSIAAVSNSQLRNVYAKVLNCRNMMDIQLLRPKLAYIGGKVESTNASKDAKFQTQLLVRDLEKLAQKVTDDEKVKYYKDFLEMLVAYHKQFGKKD